MLYLHDLDRALKGQSGMDACGGGAPRSPGIVVAIPARNEADAIETCLAALATQRDAYGAPVAVGTFEILVYANNCDDGTVASAEAFAQRCPHPIIVQAAALPRERAQAGWARKGAMDLAADRLEARCHKGGAIFTTDADSAVSPTWIDANRIALVDPVDCVAGYIDAFPAEIMRLGSAFVARGRLEDHYLRLMAELYALCDPRRHDPWPNHRVSSGASLAVTLAAYRAIGGLPPIPLGEDAAFTRRLEIGGFKVRHPMSVGVGTSCRFDGRARGGAADTMRQRHEQADAPCDDEIEPARAVLWRALCRGAMRKSHAEGTLDHPSWAMRLGLRYTEWQSRFLTPVPPVFEQLWTGIEAISPALTRRQTLRPADLPAQIGRAESILQRLRAAAVTEPEGSPEDRSRPLIGHVSEVA